MTKILQAFNNLNDQARYGILAIGVILILAVDVFFLAMPQINSIADANDQMQKIASDTQEVRANSPRISQLKKSLGQAQEKLDSLSMKVRAIQEVPAILSDVSSIANEYNVKIDQLVPEKTQQETLISSPDVKYYALPIVIKAHCGYHMFGHFLNKLEGENMCFVMKEFIIQNDDKDPHTQLFSLIIKLILMDKQKAPLP